MSDTVVLVALAALVAALLIAPLVRRRPTSDGALSPPAPGDAAAGDAPGEDLIEAALREIEFDRQTGRLTDEDYAQLRARYEAQRAARRAAPGVPASAPPAPPAGSARAEGASAAVSAPDEAALEEEAEALVAQWRGQTTACPDCGIRPEPQAAYCSNCGRRLAPCASCGAPLPEAAARFCPRCGASLVA